MNNGTVIITQTLFSSVDSDFCWANAGAAVFERVQERQETPNDGEEENSDEEAPKNDDIHFEPIVSLPEVFHTAFYTSTLKCNVLFGTLGFIRRFWTRL